MRKMALLVISLIVLNIVQVSCSTGDGEIINAPHSIESIITGEQVELDSATLTTAGGTITVNEPDCPANGLEIQVSAEAYSQNVNFNISYSPVESHILGDEVVSISPVIGIENGGHYSKEPLMVTVPAKIPEGHFAMAFYFDEETGNLEGIPSFSQNNESVTLVTTHFSLFTLFAIEKEKLLNLDIDTGFTVGQDDWNLLNAGSYVNPEGYCAGMTLSAVWYYTREKPSTGEPLWDMNESGPETGMETPYFWLDDWWAIRFCATVQEECYSFQHMPWDSFLWENYDISLAGTANRATFYSLAFSLYLSDKLHQEDPGRIVSPQTLGVWNENSGHSLICYKIKDNVLYIADPNMAGKENPNTPTIIYDDKNGLADGSFSSYSSAQNTRDFENGHYNNYTKVRFRGVGSFAAMQKIDDMWTNAENGRCVGQDSGRCFPDYRLSIEATDKDGNKNMTTLDLENGAVVYADTINILLLDWPGLAFLDIYDYATIKEYEQAKAKEKDNSENTSIEFPKPVDLSQYRLKQGDNYFGLFLSAVNLDYEAQQNKSAQESPDLIQSWTGFDWVNIRYENNIKTEVQPDNTEALWDLDKVTISITLQQPEYFSDGTIYRWTNNDALGTAGGTHWGTGSFSNSHVFTGKSENEAFAVTHFEVTLDEKGSRLVELIVTRTREDGSFREVRLGGIELTSKAGRKYYYEITGEEASQHVYSLKDQTGELPFRCGDGSRIFIQFGTTG